MENKLINSGYSFLNFNLEEKRKFKTYVILGLGRSGTSMVAGTLHTLGIYMGDKLGHTYEDPVLSAICEKKDFKSAKEMIDKRNKEYSQWGWKRPSSVNYIEKMEDMFEDVIFLVVWRDIFAIANRNKISMEYDLIESMEQSIKSYRRLLSFVNSTTKPTVLISYEKAMLKKDTFIELLCNLTNIKDESKKDDAQLFITNNPKEYLNSSRINAAKGSVGKIKESNLSGWVFYPKLPEKTVTVHLLLNGKVVARTEANLFRKRLQEESIHKSGLCGFSFNKLGNLGIKLGDEIVIIAENDVLALRNGKYIVDENFFDE